MTQNPNEPEKRTGGFRINLSLDWWAVITALALVFLVASGIITAVPW
ncbi:MAG: hypothetical protein R3E39_12065 [Anaerolineae bacterium]